MITLWQVLQLYGASFFFTFYCVIKGQNDIHRVSHTEYKYVYRVCVFRTLQLPTV